MAADCTRNCTVLVFALLAKVRELQEQVHTLQTQCRHVFVETSESDIRTCLSCGYTEAVICRFPNV
ncbi:hypothetical protein ACFQPF_07195 [Fictibacillus iocasae]|uniref:Uncharacterized protein n=1 Tax=Fictibacillus iocasae TaxID=2715437 RepID=A0ABW2NPK5_9BACL